MKKNLCLLGLMFVCLFIVSCAQEEAEPKEELNIEQKIGQLQEKIQELAVKIETNPESDEAGAWRGEHHKYINEMEELMAGAKSEIPRGEISEEMRLRRAMQEYRGALEQYPDDEDAGKWREALHELELEFEKLVASGEIQRFPEIENALENKEEQLLEMELYLVDLREKGESEEKIKATEEQMDKIRNEKKELQIMLENRRLGIQEERPSTYQQEQGEIEGYVISATSEAVTVRVEDSEKVMVIRVPQRIRVEGERIDNSEMKNLASKLKKDEMIWIDYRGGEERGTYYAVGMKKLK
jgi:hypothetical protein